MKKVHLKMALPFLMILLISCKHRTRRADILNYYITVQLQTRQVDDLVRIFSSDLSKVCSRPLVVKNHILDPGSFDSLKSSLRETIVQIDKRLMVLYNLPSFNGDIMLKLHAAHYIKDCREVLTNDISLVIRSYKSSSNLLYVPNTNDRKLFVGRKYSLIIDAKSFKKFSEIYRKIHSISAKELTGYSLE